MVQDTTVKTTESIAENAMNIGSWMDQGKEYLFTYGPRIFTGLAIILAGNWIISKVVGAVHKALVKAGLDTTLTTFLEDAVSAIMRIFLIISAVGIMGVDTSSVVTVISALLVGVGMALNGTIGHIASGVMLMIFKPFKIGDLVKVGGNQVIGTVDAISAFNTILKTLDNKKIIIANTNVINNDITNISGQGTVGVELTFGIGYGDDIKKAKEIILQVGNTCPHILKDPAQGVVVAELADSSVNLATRPFCKSEHYWDVKFFMQENVKIAFDEAGISIPFPQMDVHTHNA